MSDLLDILARWRPVRVLVVGDYMLDQLVYGDAERLSPDAPVPVLAVKRTESRPGGAANVCLDLVAMRCEVRAAGIVGDDAEAREMRDSLTAQGVDVRALVTDPMRPTTTKRSLIGLAQHRHPQKMFRLDIESKTDIAGDALDALLAHIREGVAWADVVCIEDYGKGACCARLCEAAIAASKQAEKPVLVDPAPINDYSRYTGATAITPNRSEAEIAARIDLDPLQNSEPRAQWAELAARLGSRHDIEKVVLTLDKDGALLHDRVAPPAHIPTVARTVYDVTGAGDMVLAALAAAIGNGASWADSVRFANAAAGLEVEVFGVEPIPLENIHHALLLEANAHRGKTRTLNETLVEVAAHRRAGRRIVFTNGCFDILHAGHVRMLREAASFGDFLIVGLNSDASVRRLKGEGRPVHGERDRAEVLGELVSVGAVVVFEEDTPLRLIEAIAPDVLVKGADYTKDRVVGADIVEARGGRVELVRLLEGRSTTGAIDRIRGAHAQ